MYGDLREPMAEAVDLAYSFSCRATSSGTNEWSNIERSTVRTNPGVLDLIRHSSLVLARMLLWMTLAQSKRRSETKSACALK